MSGKRKYQMTIEAASDKLARVMERMGVEKYDFDYAESKAAKSCWVELLCNGRAYRFVNDTAKSAACGRGLVYMSDLFVELVYALEDLARAVEKGIFTLDMLLEGKMALPAENPMEPCFLALGFASRPESATAVKERYRQLAKALHPDAGGDQAAFMALRENYESCLKLMEAGGT